MLLAVLLATTVGLAPTLPEAVPDMTSWDPAWGSVLSRTMKMDVVRPGGLTIKFLQTRGICPESQGADCAYLVLYEYRRKVADGKLHSFVQRYTVVSSTGVVTHGVAYFRYTKDGYGASVPSFDFYFLKGDRWLSEEPGTEEYLTAGDFFMMLAEGHEKSGF